MDYKNYRTTFIGILANLAVLFSVSLGLALLFGTVVFEGKGTFIGVIHLFLAPVFLFAPRWIFWRYFEKKYNAGFLRFLEIFALIIYFSTSAGTFYFYDVSPFSFLGYDTLVHFSVFFQIAAVFVLIFGFLKNISFFSFRQKTVIFISGVILCLIGGIGWELFQKYGDEIFKTEMFGDVNQRIDYDVISDLSANIFGGAAGLFFAMIKYGEWRRKFVIDNQ